MAKKSKVAEPDASMRVVLIAGKEPLLRSMYTDKVREALEAEHGEVEVFRFDGASAAAAEVLDECRSFGLMQRHKLVVVDQADQAVKEASRALFERYAAAPTASATLVLRCEKWNKGKKLDDLIAKHGAVIPCEELKPAEARVWAARRCAKRHGATLDRAAAELLVERVGTDLGRLDSELGKLSPGATAGADGEPRITVQDVMELVGRSREEEIWGIQGAILTGRAEEALGYLRAVLDNAPRDAHIPVSWACVDLARKVNGASWGARQRVNPGELGRVLKLWPPDRQAAVLDAGRRLDPRGAARLLAEAVRMDVGHKSGLGRPDRSLEAMAVRFTSALGG